MNSVLLISALWIVFAPALWLSARSMPLRGREPLHPGAWREWSPRIEREFLVRVVLAAFALRIAVVLLLTWTDAIRTLHLSPDSLKYHRVGKLIAADYRRGMIEWGDWIVTKADDNFWSKHASVSGLFQGSEAQETFVEISTFDDRVHAGGWWHQLAFLTYPNTMNGQFTVKMRVGLRMKDTAFYTGTKNFGSGISCTSVR